MRRVLLAYGSILLFVSCANSRAPIPDTPRQLHDSGQLETAAVTQTLLALSQQWVYQKLVSTSPDNPIAPKCRPTQRCSRHQPAPRES